MKIFNRKYIILFITLLIIVLLPFLCVDTTFIHYKELKYRKSINIKIGNELPSITDYVNSEDLDMLDSKEIVWKSLVLDDNKIYVAGNYNGYISFRNKKIILELNVIDDLEPNIEGVKDITIYVNNSVDLLKNIKVTDNSKDEIRLEVIGDYNTNKVGEYKLSYVAVDVSNNKTIKEFKLIVKEKEIIKPSLNISELVGTTSKGYQIKKVNGIYYINDILIANKTYQLPSTYNPGGLLTSFLNNFNNLKNAASNDGVSLRIISGYRSYSSQNSIYNNYVKKDGQTKADTYSARPGHSEHQTGLAADINSLYSSFINTKEGKWLNDNCYKYGFIIRYPQGKEHITGYMYEPWHIRYVGTDLATILYNSGNWISLEEYFGITSSYDR